MVAVISINRSAQAYRIFNKYILYFIAALAKTSFSIHLHAKKVRNWKTIHSTHTRIRLNHNAHVIMQIYYHFK